MTVQEFRERITGEWKCEESSKRYFFKFDGLQMYEPTKNGEWSYTDDWSIEEVNGNVKNVSFGFLNLADLVLTDSMANANFLTFSDPRYTKRYYLFSHYLA